MPTDGPQLIDKDDKGAKGLSNAEDKVSDNVKNVIKHINTTDNITLDDINSARQAVAKIEALIDVEKHLNELEKLRNERDGNSRSSFNSIPASALIPTPPPAMAAPSMPADFQPVMMMATTEVSRITGSAGRYSAVVKTPDGQSKTVQVGDHVGGGKVISITASGVELEQGKTKRLMPVKNIEMVSSHTP